MKESTTFNTSKYFIAFFEKGTTIFNTYPKIMVLMDKAWVGIRVDTIDVEYSGGTLLQRRSVSSDDDNIVWFESIDAAYEFIGSERFKNAIDKSNIDIIDKEVEWSILQTTSNINVITSCGDEDIDTVLAKKALEDLSGKLTPEQLQILKNLVP